MALGIGRCLLEKRKGHKRDRESDHKSSSPYLCRFLSNAVWSFCLLPSIQGSRTHLLISFFLSNLLTEEKVFLWIWVSFNFSNLLLFFFFFRFHRTLTQSLIPQSRVQPLNLDLYNLLYCIVQCDSINMVNSDSESMGCDFPCTLEEERRIVTGLMSEAEDQLKEGNLYFVISNR